MVKELSINEKERIFLDVIDRMKQYTAPSITQVCGNFDEETGELLGTGTFFEIRNSLFFLTAQHVAANMYKENIDGSRKYAAGLSHSVGNNQRMRWFPNGDNWTPDMARVVGLVNGFNHDWRCLVVTRIEYVKGMLLHALRSDFAYSRWVERGKPLWEDLEDWSAAENTICDLNNPDSINEQGEQN